MKTEIKSAKGHQRYRLKDRTIVPGVTTIVGLLNKGEMLMRWHNKMGLDGIDTSKYVDKLAEAGTLGHYLIQCHLKGDKPDLDEYSPELIDLAENSFLSYLEWEKQHTLLTIDCEAMLVSEQHRYGGQVDWIGQLDGVPCIMDFKTGKKIYDDHLVQVSAYWHLAVENKLRVHEARILQIGRSEDEGFSERVIKDASRHWGIFEHLLAIYYLRKED